MNLAVLVGRLLLAAVFTIAALTKLADRAGLRKATADLGVPARMAGPVAALLPLVELMVAVALVPTFSARWGALAAFALLALFAVVIGANLASGRKPDCHCFGQLHSAPVGWSTLFRNGVLAAVAGFVFWRGGDSPELTTVIASASFSAPAWLALGVALIALVLAALEGWFLLNLVTQHGRLLARLETAEAALRQAGVAQLPVGRQAPDFELSTLSGQKLSLTALRSSGKPLLLVFANPDCAPCDAVMPRIARWQREHVDHVQIAVITRGSVQANRAKAEQQGVGTVLVQKEREVTDAYYVDSVPSAILVSPDGRIASQITYGGEGMEGLVRQAMNGEVGDRRDVIVGNGDRDRPAPEPPIVGKPAPDFDLADVDGKRVRLVDFAGTSTLVLFWSPDCTFCRQMLPELKAWERKRPAHSPRLLVVSSGSVEANRAMGLTSPLVLDSDGSTMRAFGARGTPMAVLVDSTVRIASSLAAGAQQVMELARAQSQRI